MYFDYYFNNVQMLRGLLFFSFLLLYIIYHDIQLNSVCNAERRDFNKSVHAAIYSIKDFIQSIKKIIVKKA